MRKGKDVIGLPVISIDTGKQVGTVKDITVGSDWQLKAIVLEAKNWFTSGKSVAATEIVGFGGDAVTIADEQAARPHEDVPYGRPLTDGPGKLFGLPVLTVNGTKLGTIEDVYFQPEMGIPMIGFELSEGFLSDLQEGRKTLSLPAQAKLGEDAIVVPTTCLDEIEDRFVSQK